MVMSKMVILYIVMPLKLFAISKMVFDISVSGLEPGAIIFWASILSNYILSKYYKVGGGLGGGG